VIFTMPYQISTNSVSASLRQSILKLQAEFAERSTEIATGKHKDVGLFLGRQSGSLVSLKSEQAYFETLIETNNLASLRLGTTQTLLDRIQDSAESVLNALIVNDGLPANAGALEAVGRSELNALIAAMNSSLQGIFLFAGINSDTKPVTDYFATGAVSKAAVDAAFQAAFGVTQDDANVAGISGTDMQDFLDGQFAALFEPSGWSANWSSAADETLTQQVTATQWVETSISANAEPFRKIAAAYTMLADLGTSKLGADALGAVTETAIDLLRSGIAGVTQLGTNAGFAQSSVRDATTQLSVQLDLFASQIGLLENVNPYEAASSITELQTQLEMSFALTARIQELSLAYYL
jgi:flagellar hook-associated protein 3 FlgL